MLIFLYGPDTYRSRQKLDEIIERYKKIHKSGLNLRMVDCLISDFQDLKQELETISMFKEKKLIILKNVFLNSLFEKSFLDYKENLLIDKENIILFFEDGEIKQKNGFFQFLKKNSKSQEFNLLSGQSLKNWVKKEVVKYRFKIEDLAIERLILYCGNNLWRLSNEIQKLVALKLKEKILKICLNDIDILVKPEIETDIFETIDAVANKNKKNALGLLKKHLEKGEPPLQLLAMINYQFRNLLIVKDLVDKGVQYHLILKKTGLHPFVIKKSYELCRKFTISELKKIYHKIFQADLDIKTGRIDPETALDLLIVEI